MQLFFPFSQVTKTTNPRFVGQRGLQLADLFNEGFPVQDGFVIGASVMREFVVASGIREKLFLWLKQGKKEKIIDLLRQKSVPDIEAKIVEQCKSLGITNAFLQSSCVFKEHKFVTGNKDSKTIMDAVKECWASVFCNTFMDRLNSKNCFSAVVVQNAVNVKKSGFIYTEFPGDSNHMVVEVVKPKRYYFLVEKDSLKAQYLKEFGALESPLRLREQDYVAKLGKNISAHYGFGAKIHWALSNRFYITTVRELGEKDKDYFANQVSSSELRSNSLVN